MKSLLCCAENDHCFPMTFLSIICFHNFEFCSIVTPLLIFEFCSIVTPLLIFEFCSIVTPLLMFEFCSIVTPLLIFEFCSIVTLCLYSIQSYKSFVERDFSIGIWNFITRFVETQQIIFVPLLLIFFPDIYLEITISVIVRKTNQQ